MSTLLNVSENKICSNVHEYRLDEVSAIYNLLMEDHLNSKRLVTDHTTMQGVRRPHAAEGGAKQDGGGVDVRKSEEQETTATDAVEVRVSLRTPTIIAMVRPSQADAGVDRRMLKSADFELRAIKDADVTSSKRRRPKTCFTQCGSKGKPMGNATTHNIMLARSNNFGSPVPSPHQKLKAQRNEPKGVTAPAPEPEEITLPCERDASPKPGPEENALPCERENNSDYEHLQFDKRRQQKTLRFATEVDGRIKILDQIDTNDECNESTSRAAQNDSVRGKTQCAAISKSSAARQLQLQMCDDCAFVVINPNLPESQKEVKVIDMVQYFNTKHGYRVSETPFVFPKGKVLEPDAAIKSKVNRKSQVDSSKESYCDSDRDVVTLEMPQTSHAVAYKRCTPYAGSGMRKEDETQPPTAIDIKLPRNDEGYQSDSESERGPSATHKRQGGDHASTRYLDEGLVVTDHRRPAALLDIIAVIPHHRHQTGYQTMKNLCIVHQ
ncbi:uncharacterized protein [Amphiura filiformis]|uniref:uncharacterized protein n=1 Tax=Amphiura filiformis TaxID=82378 RepID=UPI003B221069